MRGLTFFGPTRQKPPLRMRIGGIYKKTRNTIEANGEMSSKFWTTKGVRQGCPLSPTLFTIYVADLEETMRKNQEGGVRVGKEKIWTLVYALLANEPKDLKGVDTSRGLAIDEV